MHDLAGRVVIIRVNHQPARKNSDATFQYAHIYVHLEAGYILPPEKGGGKGDDCHVGAA